MPTSRSVLAAAALLAGLAACQQNKEAPATNEPSEAPVPEGTDVGAMGSDATAAPLPGDTATAGRVHP